MRVNLRSVLPYWKWIAIGGAFLLTWLIYSGWRTDIVNQGRWEQGEIELKRIKKENRDLLAQRDTAIAALRQAEGQTQIKIVKGKDRIVTIEREKNVELEKVDSLDSTALHNDVLRRAGKRPRTHF